MGTQFFDQTGPSMGASLGKRGGSKQALVFLVWSPQPPENAMMKGFKSPPLGSNFLRMMKDLIKRDLGTWNKETMNISFTTAYDVALRSAILQDKI